MGNAESSSADSGASEPGLNLGGALDNLSLGEAWSLPKVPDFLGHEGDGDGPGSFPGDRDMPTPPRSSPSHRSASPSDSADAQAQQPFVQPAGESRAQAGAPEDDRREEKRTQAPPGARAQAPVGPQEHAGRGAYGAQQPNLPAAASHKQLELLRQLSEENSRLQELKNYYTQRLASPLATAEQFELLKQQRSNVVPRLQETDEGVLCEGQINKTLAISLEAGSQDKTRRRVYSDTMKNVLEKQGISVGMVDRLTVRKCWSTGDGASATSAIRTLGSVKHITIEDCHKSTILVDGVSSSCTISSCSMLTLVIGGELPHLHLTKCEKIKIIGCISRGRPHDLCMSCCEQIVTCLHQDEGNQLRSAVKVAEEEDDARTIYLPDTVEAHVQGHRSASHPLSFCLVENNRPTYSPFSFCCMFPPSALTIDRFGLRWNGAPFWGLVWTTRLGCWTQRIRVCLCSVICELENSSSVPDDCLPMTGDTTIEFVMVDHNAAIAAVALESHEEHQSIKHRAHKHAKHMKTERVRTLGSTKSFKLRTTGSFVTRNTGSAKFEKLAA